jgi:hypothetical protein
MAAMGMKRIAAPQSERVTCRRIAKASVSSATDSSVIKKLKLVMLRPKSRKKGMARKGRKLWYWAP